MDLNFLSGPPESVCTGTFHSAQEPVEPRAHKISLIAYYYATGKVSVVAR